MRIYELDLHYVLCRLYVFVLMLTNKTDDGGKCYLHQQFQVKSTKLVYFNTFVLTIALKFFLKQLSL